MLRSFVVTLIILLNFCSKLIADDINQLPENTVTITSEQWCPYTCLDSDQNQGLLIDITKAALNEAGLKVVYKSTASFERALQNVKDGTADVVPAIMIQREVNMHIAKEFYILHETVFAVRKDSGIILNNPEDLLDYKIAIVSGYIFDNEGAPWLSVVDNHPNRLEISTSTGESHLLKLLLRGRVDIVAVDIDVAKHSLNLLGRASEVTLIRKNLAVKHYNGFTLNERGKLLKNKFNEGFIRLKDSNRLKSIYQKYDIEMPELSNSKL